MAPSNRILALAALALIPALPVAAATITSAAPNKYSLQGQQLSGPNAVQALPVLTVTLGADYSVNDNIRLTLAGASVGGATSTNLNNAANIVCNGGPAIIVSFITRAGNDISLRVTQKNVQNTVGVQCTISGIELTAPSLDAVKNITASWNASTALTNIAFDPGAATKVAEVIDQLTTSVTQVHNGIVDVSAPSYRSKFLTDDPVFFPGNEDVMVLETTVDGLGLFGPAVTVTNEEYRLVGNFQHVDTNGDGDCSNDALGAITVWPNAAADCRSLYGNYAFVIADGSVSGAFSITGNGSRVIVAPQSFTLRAKYTYTLGAVTGTRTDELAAGAWTLNGFQAFVDYLPYGANLTQIIYLANKGNQTGEIQVDARNEAGAACSFAAGTAGANRVQVLSAAIQSGLEGCYGAGFSGKVHFTLIAAIPPSEAELYTGYTVNGTDRPVVVNSSNGR